MEENAILEHILENYFYILFLYLYITFMKQKFCSVMEANQVSLLLSSSFVKFFHFHLLNCLPCPIIPAQCLLRREWWAELQWTLWASQHFESGKKRDLFFFQLLFLSTCRSSLGTGVAMEIKPHTQKKKRKNFTVGKFCHLVASRIAW